MEGITRGRARTDIHTRSDAVERQAARARVMLPRLEESQARIALGLFRTLAEGEPVLHQQLAERLTVPKEEVSATLAAFARRLLQRRRMDRGLLGPWPWEEPPPSGGRGTNRVRVVLPGHPVLPADPGQDRTDRIDVS